MLLWLIAYICILLVGVIAMVMFWGEHTSQRPSVFWSAAFGLPTLCWGLLAGGRWLLYSSQQLMADNWDEERRLDIFQQTQRGRRSLQILSISLHTAFDENNPDSQLLNLMQSKIAFKAQRSWQGKEAIRHSRLSLLIVAESIEEGVKRLLGSIFNDFAETLGYLPAEMPLQLVIESETPLNDETFHQIWQDVWEEAGIMQPICRIQGSGLSLIDNWLDNNIHEAALLVVVALQIRPEHPDMTAESAAGLIFGNRLTQKSLIPLAYLHRPELAPETAIEYGVRQALDWVPLAAEAISHVWISGISPSSSEVVTTVMADVPFDVARDRGIYDLDSSLGYPGCVTPWLAIAVAAQAAQTTSSPQFTFSGACPEAGVWSAVVSPYLTSQEMTP
ncbi:hypothetical protein GTU79_28535 [Sodalis ligni]|nr:hypothetical protein [Sodalis ligni]QWA11032.1 hypothetical protein GTU79_28535 [Sodalis ligni]